ncbi:MAG: hypothetical protein KJP19_05920, partial [Deltaproteobacteria bacterium]|nr:hypothetical protein [Deltaproteobacteria bacterium]
DKETHRDTRNNQGIPGSKSIGPGIFYFGMLQPLFNERAFCKMMVFVQIQTMRKISTAGT